MKHLAITLMLCAVASVARAGDDRSALFACGVRFGSTELTYSTRAETKSDKTYRALNRRLQFVAGATRKETTESLQITPPQPADLGMLEKRLPPRFTFATVGCSWR
jgi:hypothetical protein